MAKLLFGSVLLVAITIVAACTVQNSEVPGLSGPSEGSGPLSPPAQTPTARFTFAPSSPAAFSPVQFDGTLSCVGPADPIGTAPCSTSGTIISYSWNFGDGSGAVGAVASHAFGNAQTYIVTLTVTNASGRSHTTARTVPVGAGTLPTAAFTVSPPAPRANLHDVTYDASTSTPGIGHRIVEYRWQFGDNDLIGCTSPSPAYCYMTPSPVVLHRYHFPGTFVTTLTVVDEVGQTRSSSVSVTVAP